MDILLTHPGTQHAHSLAHELNRHGVLERFATSLGLAEDSVLGRLKRFMPASQYFPWSNRWVPGVPSAKLHTFPVLELRALQRLWRGEPAEVVFHERNTEFQEAIPDSWIEEATHVIGFDTSSWLLAERCQALGRPFLLDQSIGHPRAKERVFHDLRVQFPEWVETVPRKSEAYLRFEDLEHSTAQLIVAPSSFVRQTLLEYGASTERIHVIPFGTDLKIFQPADTAPPLPLVFLYAGTLTARKGLPVLLEGWKQASLGRHAELWLAGPGSLPPSVVLPVGARLLGALSNARLAAVMRRAHVFVFPSLFEGLARVQVEALAAGLPVIGTNSSGATDIVVPGETGLIVASGSSEQLADSLCRLTTDTKAVYRMRKECIASREHRSWQYYGEKWFELLLALDETGNSLPIRTRS